MDCRYTALSADPRRPLVDPAKALTREFDGLAGVVGVDVLLFRKLALPVRGLALALVATTVVERAGLDACRVGGTATFALAGREVVAVDLLQ